MAVNRSPTHGSLDANAMGTAAADSTRLAVAARTLYVLPAYRQAYHRLVRPDQHQIITEYFRRHWAPRLGPTRTMVVLQLRGLALAAGPDGVEIREGDLAALCGVSESTVFRTLKDSALRPFVEKIRRRRYRRELGRVVQAPNLYLVMLDDPVLPEHEPLITAAAARMPELPGLSPLGPRAPGGVEPYPRSDPQADGLNDGYPLSDQQIDGRASGGGLTLRAKTFKTKIHQTFDTAGSHTEQPSTSATGSERQATSSVDGGSAEGTPKRGRRRDLLDEHPVWRDYVERAEQILQDTHSRGFYIKALRALAAANALDIWDRALGLAREQRPESIRRSRGALFTALLKQFAAEAGIQL